ncbi:MAG: phosphoribosylformylglycinamidine synthase I [Candidatus Brocadiia bacterium]
MDCNVFILRTAGTNCDNELAFAFRKAGAQTEQIHINRWLKDKKMVHKYDIFAIPGGFSYGDDLGAGTVLANQIKQHLLEELLKFVDDGKLIIGICNGFQALVKTGLLPRLDPTLDKNTYVQEVTLANNDSAKYEDRWVYLKGYSKKCVFTKGLTRPLYYLPVAHGEGKFIARDKAILKQLKDNDQIVFRYTDIEGKPTMRYPVNPNGATDSIAGICDTTGRVLGLMPHPERFQDFTNHPRWTREKIQEPTDGMLMFLNAVNYIKSR